MNFSLTIAFLFLFNFGVSKVYLNSYNDVYHDNYYDYEPVEKPKPKSERNLSDDWCSLSCGNRKNIACVHENVCEPRTPCFEFPLDEEKLVDLHNSLRNKFATGEVGGITVANMMALKWNEDLAFTASCNLADCTEIKKDACHKTRMFRTVGQNIWNFTGQQDIDCADKALDGIQSWYDEIALTSADEIKKYSESYKGNAKTSHFTQLIWATTTHVGCAMVKKVNDQEAKCMMTCNYGPGILRSARAFHQGIPCTDCPDPYCQINALCWLPEANDNLSRSHGAAGVLRPNIDAFILFVFFVCKSFMK